MMNVGPISLITVVVGLSRPALDDQLLKSTAAAHQIVRPDDLEFILDPARGDPSNDDLDSDDLERGLMSLMLGTLTLLFVAISL